VTEHIGQGARMCGVGPHPLVGQVGWLIANNLH
jgi:hypothetical protein